MESRDVPATGCAECGARYLTPGDGCRARWHALLALDHSRQPPWGPLHGVAFATYTLQHPSSAPEASLSRSWLVLQRLLVAGDSPELLFEALRHSPREEPVTLAVPTLPVVRPHRFAVTIADLGDFAAERYEEALWRWARATLHAWSSAGP